MARIRSIRNRGKRPKKGPFEVDITSLLDILIILLVFLLKSYNTSGIQLTIPGGIELPKSVSQSINNPGVMIQVSKDKVWVDSKTVMDSNNPPARVYDMNGRRIIPLYNELIRLKEEIDKVATIESKAKPFSGKANLILDKSLKYNYVKKIMFTCAQAGFQKFQFVVLSEEQ